MKCASVLYILYLHDTCMLFSSILYNICHACEKCASLKESEWESTQALSVVAVYVCMIFVFDTSNNTKSNGNWNACATIDSLQYIRQDTFKFLCRFSLYSLLRSSTNRKDLRCLLKSFIDIHFKLIKLVYYLVWERN